ncbi:hypothetical protein B0H13DRAFT_1884687 [Mycena leptocephala]|nr:hypothetical protein B0H13DRAFT_1884687 [Mycena leptocephala]
MADNFAMVPASESGYFAQRLQFCASSIRLTSDALLVIRAAFGVAGEVQVFCHPSIFRWLIRATRLPSSSRLSSARCDRCGGLNPVCQAYITTVPAARDPSESPHRPIRHRVLGGRALTWCGHMAYLRVLYLEHQGAVIMCYFTSGGVQYMLPRPRSQDQRRRWNDPDPKRRWARCYDGLASAPILRQLDSNTLTTPEALLAVFLSFFLICMFCEGCWLSAPRDLAAGLRAQAKPANAR